MLSDSDIITHNRGSACKTELTGFVKRHTEEHTAPRAQPAAEAASAQRTSVLSLRGRLGRRDTQGLALRSPRAHFHIITLWASAPPEYITSDDSQKVSKIKKLRKFFFCPSMYLYNKTLHFMHAYSHTFQQNIYWNPLGGSAS